MEVASVDSLPPLHMVANIQRWSIQKWNIQKWKDFIQQCLATEATWERLVVMVQLEQATAFSLVAFNSEKDLAKAAHQNMLKIFVQCKLRHNVSGLAFFWELCAAEK